MLMKILITGGAGFMGSNAIRYVLDAYPEASVLNVDKLTYAGNLDNLKDVQERFGDRYEFLRGDISDREFMEKAVRAFTPELLINFAAETHVDRSILEPENFVKTDVLGTYMLLELVKRFGIKTYIHISTDEVYGSIEKGLFTEESPFRPNSPYAASKAGGDLLCRAYSVTYKIPVIVLHSCNFFGPFQYPEKFIPLFITNLLEGKKVPLYGKGLQKREWIYTKDFCLALDIIMKKGVPGEVYNIGTGIEKANREVASILLGALGKSEDAMVSVKDRPGHDFRYALNWSKIEKLGFFPHYTFEEGIKETVQWYKEHSWWWEKIKQSAQFQEYYKKQYGNFM